MAMRGNVGLTLEARSQASISLRARQWPLLFSPPNLTNYFNVYPSCPLNLDVIRTNSKYALSSS